MDGATCCWGAYTCYTWCIGSYTDKKNVSLQATCSILSFYHWQKTQIVWVCVRGESAGIGEKPLYLAYRRSFMLSTSSEWSNWSTNLTCSAFSSGHYIWTCSPNIQHHTCSSPAVSRILFYRTLSDKPGHQQSVPAVHRKTLNISCSLYFLGNEGRHGRKFHLTVGGGQ